MIRNVVFDMGMVLMDYHPLAACRAVAPDEAGAQALNAALFSHPEWIKVDEGGIELSELGRHAKARLADPALRPLIDALLDGMPENILAPIPGMGEVVESLLAGGFRLYLLSNAGTLVSRRRAIIPHIERFSGVLFSADERIIKPDAAIYRLLTERYGLVPDECLFIDDNEDNLNGARRQGWQGYRFDGDVPALRRALDALAGESRR